MNLKQYPRYKESGLEYIGKIPEHWEILPLKRISKRIVVGIAEAATQSYVDKGVPLIRSTNIKSGIIDTDDLLYIAEDFAKKNSSKYLYSNDLLTVRTGDAGQTAVVPNSLNKSQCFTMLITTLEKNYNPSFYNYFLNSSSGISYFDVTAWGTAQKNISVPILKECLVPILPLAEQDTIVRYLDAQTLRVDNAIDKDKQLIELLKEKRIALINQAVTKGLDPRAKLKDSGNSWIGKIPEGWSLSRLKFLVSKRAQYGANKEPEYRKGELDVRYVRITDIDDKGNLRKDSFAYLANENAKGYVLNDGDVLFARSGATVGKVYHHTKDNGNCCYAGYLIRYVPNKEKLLPKFLLYYSLSKVYNEWINAILVQATIENVSADKYDNLILSLPSKAEQIKIVSYLDFHTSKIEGIIRKIQRRIDSFEEYKKSLINNVVTGKIDVNTG
jgi:restriction endonuclease S subunit